MRLFLIIFPLFLLGCAAEVKKTESKTVISPRDWKEIKTDSVLTVLAENSPASYFIYRGRNMGYEYELLYEFCKDKNIRLQIEMVHDLDEIINQLNAGYGDVIACNLTITEKRKELISFSESHLTTHQVLIQRKPEKWRSYSKKTLNDSLITRIEGLYGKTIHVWKNSTYFEQITLLNDRLNLDLTIIPTEGDQITEELIRSVSEGKIDYTIADENIAKIDLGYYPNLDISVKLSDENKIGFGVRKTSNQLLTELNGWLTDKKNRSTIGEVNRKYFKRKTLVRKANETYSSLNGEVLSPYDEIIKRESEKIGWDWRLISAIIYQESKFETWKVSWAGAFGIFQFMPATAAGYGISPASSAEEQIIAGVKKLTKNYNQWLEEIADSTEAMKFTLATFNAGRAHVDDARALAASRGYKDTVWADNVSVMIKNLSKPSFYRDEVVKYGYCRGTETYEYVIEIIQRFEEYKAAFPDSPAGNNRDLANK